MSTAVVGTTPTPTRSLHHFYRHDPRWKGGTAMRLPALCGNSLRSGGSTRRFPRLF
jgi:hypothetical protein